MSKAFTKEDDGVETPVLPVRPADGRPRYVTPRGLEAMRREHARLVEERRAAAASDELDDKARLAELDRRIATLELTLASVTPAPPPTDRTRVSFGARVTLEDEEGDHVTWELVGPDEADAKAGLLSVESPLARGLLGRAVDDEVTIERPRGTAEYTIARIDWPTDDE